MAFWYVYQRRSHLRPANEDPMPRSSQDPVLFSRVYWVIQYQQGGKDGLDPI